MPQGPEQLEGCLSRGLARRLGELRGNSLEELLCISDNDTVGIKECIEHSTLLECMLDLEADSSWQSVPLTRAAFEMLREKQGLGSGFSARQQTNWVRFEADKCRVLFAYFIRLCRRSEWSHSVTILRLKERYWARPGMQKVRKSGSSKSLAVSADETSAAATPSDIGTPASPAPARAALALAACSPLASPAALPDTAAPGASTLAAPAPRLLIPAYPDSEHDSEASVETISSGDAPEQEPPARAPGALRAGHPHVRPEGLNAALADAAAAPAVDHMAQKRALAKRKGGGQTEKPKKKPTGHGRPADEPVRAQPAAAPAAPLQIAPPAQRAVVPAATLQTVAPGHASGVPAIAHALMSTEPQLGPAELDKLKSLRPQYDYVEAPLGKPKISLLWRTVALISIDYKKSGVMKNNNKLRERVMLGNG